MTLLEKTPPSVLSPEKKAQLVSTVTRLNRVTHLHFIQVDEDQQLDVQSPPAYKDVVGSTPDLPAGSNMISISHSNKSIKGTWVIDTRLGVPSSLASSSSSGRANYNLSLSTKNGSIVADVALTSGGSDRASIFLHDYNGSIKFYLVCMPLPPFTDSA
jgi:hypothetical protein